MENHHIIIGWNERSRQLIKIIRDKQAGENIVLIDSTLDSLPEHELNFMYIKGDASETGVLAKANINRANSVIITADPTKGEEEADQYSILLTISVKVANPHIKIVTEILSKKHLENAKRAGATTIIRSNEFMGSLFFHQIHGRECGEQPERSFLKHLIAQKYKTLPVTHQLEGSTFKECQSTFLSEENLLIGIVCNGNISINPPGTTVIKSGDLLIAL